MNNETNTVELETVETEEVQQEEQEQVNVLRVKTRIRAGLNSCACSIEPSI